MCYGSAMKLIVWEGRREGGRGAELQAVGGRGRKEEGAEAGGGCKRSQRGWGGRQTSRTANDDVCPAMSALPRTERAKDGASERASERRRKEIHQISFHPSMW